MKASTDTSRHRLGGALLALALAVQPAIAAARPAATGVQSRTALSRPLLSASESTRTARAGRIVKRRFGKHLSALVVTRDATLETLRRRYPRDVREPRRGVWELRRTVLVARGATLAIGAPIARELRLVSRHGAFASIIARGANLAFHGRHGRHGRRLIVHSWDPAAHRPDRVLSDGRSVIAVRGRGRLDASDATFARLGFYRGTVSGFALWARAPAFGTGTVIRSRFAHNFNGAFTYGARDMRWIDSTFVYNRIYGLDPHTGSSDFLVEGNHAARNGRHGIIFSRSCFRNVIRGNLSEHNRRHGIVIDDGKSGNRPSDSNVVVDNIVRDNARVGIQIDGSAHNLIRGNRIAGSRQGIRVLGPARDNILAANSVSGARDFGVVLHPPSQGTLLVANAISATPTGVRIHGSSDVTVTRNRIVRVTSHAVKVDDAGLARVSAVVLFDNRLEGSGPSPVSISAADPHAVRQRANETSWNYPIAHDVSRVLRTDVGPGLWALLAVTALGGPALFSLLRLPGRRRSGALTTRAP